MVTIRKVRFKDYSALMEFTIPEQQQQFVYSFSEIFEQRTPEHDIYVINEGKQLLGFFMLDKAYAKQYTFAKAKELGFRNLVIDEKHQRKGYAKQAFQRLFIYLYGAYPDYNSLCLTVNKKNTAAYNLYNDVGFTDTEKTFHGGDAGPQRIMRKPIN